MIDKLGELDLNKVYCMDCFEGLKKIPNNSVDLILTDPPYNTGMNSKVTSPKNHPTVRFNSNKNTKKPRLFGFFNDSYNDESYFNLVNNSCNEFYRVLKDNKAIYIFINWKSLGLWLNCLENAGFKNKNVIVWDKVVHGLNYQNYAYTYELIIFSVKGNFFPKNKDKKYYKDVWHIKRIVNTSSEEGHHETEKRLEVLRVPILHSSKQGEIVLDAFVGGGK